MTTQLEQLQSQLTKLQLDKARSELRRHNHLRTSRTYQTYLRKEKHIQEDVTYIKKCIRFQEQRANQSRINKLVGIS